MTVNYYDSCRKFVPLGDSIYVGEMEYIGEPGSLEPLYQLFDRVEKEQQETEKLPETSEPLALES